MKQEGCWKGTYMRVIIRVYPEGMSVIGWKFCLVGAWYKSYVENMIGDRSLHESSDLEHCICAD